MSVSNVPATMNSPSVISFKTGMSKHGAKHCKWKGARPSAALWSRVGAKGCWRHFFKNPTTQLRVDWVLTEKKCEQTPKFACFSVQRRPLHLSQAEMLPSHAVLKEGIK